MFYDAGRDDHGLAHDPFKAMVAPRPIGWIGTAGRDGSHNLAPHSFFNIISEQPKLVMFSCSDPKNTLKNCEETGVFTASMVSRDLSETMNVSSIDAPYGVSEFELAGLTPVRGRMVDAPYVGEAWGALECRVTDIYRPKGLDGVESRSHVIVGQVVCIHIDETVITAGRIDLDKASLVARMGYRDYCDTSSSFEMVRPKWPTREG